MISLLEIFSQNFATSVFSLHLTSIQASYYEYEAHEDVLHYDFFWLLWCLIIDQHLGDIEPIIKPSSDFNIMISFLSYCWKPVLIHAFFSLYIIKIKWSKSDKKTIYISIYLKYENFAIELIILLCNNCSNFFS